MRVSTRQLEGRDHFVVPCVMLTHGVHNGSGGPIYYPAEALKRSAPLWNGKPLVVYHPKLYTSGYAGNPDVFNRQKVGTVFNTRFDGYRLTTEAWIDAARVALVDRRVLEAIQAHRMMEVSTGLEVSEDGRAGVYNGRNYRTAAANLIPDHLAILPDQRGACSIADGAGLLRNMGALASV